MRVQDYSPPKLTLGIVGIVAAVIPILLGYFLVSGMATSANYTSAFAGGSTTTTTTSAAVGTVAVSIPSGAGSPNGAPGYAPDSITVVIGTNNTVIWTNNDNTHHTVTATAGNGTMNSGDMAPGATFNFTFTAPGTYDYICSYHSWMKGTVVVVAGTGSSGVHVSIPSGASNPANTPGYSPDKITLVLGVNATVTWSNDDSAPHTVTSTSVPSGASSFDSGNMNAGQTFTYTFTVAGTYQYKCDYHSWMTGTVTVVSG